MERLRLQGAALGPDGALFEEKRKERLQLIEEATLKWHQAMDTAPLMIPDEPYKPVREFKPRLIRYDTPHWAQDCEYNIAIAQWALYHFQVAARADLGFEPMVWKPIILSAPPSDPCKSTGLDIPESDDAPQSD